MFQLLHSYPVVGSTGHRRRCGQQVVLIGEPEQQARAAAPIGSSPAVPFAPVASEVDGMDRPATNDRNAGSLCSAAISAAAASLARLAGAKRANRLSVERNLGRGRRTQRLRCPFDETLPNRVREVAQWSQIRGIADACSSSDPAPASRCFIPSHCGAHRRFGASNTGAVVPTFYGHDHATVHPRSSPRWVLTHWARTRWHRTQWLRIQWLRARRFRARWFRARWPRPGWVRPTDRGRTHRASGDLHPAQFRRAR